MLYIKFTIMDSSKFDDFQKLYDHMVKIRQPNFQFEEEENSKLDWDSMTELEVDITTKKLIQNLEQAPEIHRYKKLIPSYVNIFLEEYLQAENGKLKPLDTQDVLSIFNYLEYGFEVTMNSLKKNLGRVGIVEFSTSNFPFGGMERFLITLRAFDLIPTECYDGFTVHKFDWISNFEHDAIKLPKKTQAYLRKLEN